MCRGSIEWNAANSNRKPHPQAPAASKKHYRRQLLDAMKGTTGKLQRRASLKGSPRTSCSSSGAKIKGDTFPRYGVRMRSGTDLDLVVEHVVLGALLCPITCCLVFRLSISP